MPVPAVPDDQAHARPDGVTLVELKLSRGDLGELDGERAARRHRVARVHGQIEKDLFDLGRVRLDRRRVGGRPHVQLDVLADQALEDGLETLHELVQVEDARLQHLLAAQGQELPGERGCAIRRVRDQVDIAPLRILGGELHEQEGGPARDDGQEIVEVVGHAAGQSAHRLHLLRLAELGLGVLERSELLLQRLSGLMRLGVELGELAARPIEVVGQRAELVTVDDIIERHEVALSDPLERGVHLPDRVQDGAREDGSEHQRERHREDDGAHDGTGHPSLGGDSL